MKSDLLLVLIRAALVAMLVQPETVPTEGSDEFVCPTADELALNYGWVSTVEHLMNLWLIALFAAFRQPGSTLLAVLVAACLLYLGVAAIFVPDNPGSWGLLGGAIAISGGAAYMTMVTCAERLRDSIRARF
jgi:hypothetical protein